MVYSRAYAMLFGTMGAAVETTIGLNSMTNNLAVTMHTMRCQLMDRTLKTVKDMALSIHHHFKGTLILIATNFAYSHSKYLLLSPTGCMPQVY
jgi:hypothetical protein